MLAEAVSRFEMSQRKHSELFLLLPAFAPPQKKTTVWSVKENGKVCPTLARGSKVFARAGTHARTAADNTHTWRFCLIVPHSGSKDKFHAGSVELRGVFRTTTDDLFKI